MTIKDHINANRILNYCTNSAFTRLHDYENAISYCKGQDLKNESELLEARKVIHQVSHSEEYLSLPAFKK